MAEDGMAEGQVLSLILITKITTIFFTTLVEEFSAISKLARHYP
jgi:hypothetical protein